MDLLTPSAGLLFWMVLIFGLVFLILAKFGFPIITRMISGRTDHINKSLDDARKAREQLEGMQQTCNQMMQQARAEQSALIEEARASARKVVQDAREQAAREAAQIIAKAQEDIDLRKREALAQVSNAATDLSIAVAEKILRANLSDDRSQMELVDRLVAQTRENGSDAS